MRKNRRRNGMKSFVRIIIVSLLLLVGCARMPDEPGVPTKPNIPTLSETEPTIPTTNPVETTVPATIPTEPTKPQGWTHEAALNRFLTDINHRYRIENTDVVDPGSMTPVDLIPQPEQSLVGTTVELILAREQEAIAFYYAYDEETETERLAVIIPAERIPMLMILETDFSGIDGLCAAIASESVFEGKILGIANISYEEGRVYARNACTSDYGILQEEIIDVSAETISQKEGQFLGFVGEYADREVCFVKGNTAEQMGKELQDDIEVWMRTFERFSLMDVLAN